MKATTIEWTDFSSNPLKYRDREGRIVWGCVKKSSGCLNCYAEQIAKHYDRGGPFTRATMQTLTPFLDEKDLRQILTAKRINGQPVAGKRCFLGDMTDVFGDWVPDALLDRLFVLLARDKHAPALVWLWAALRQIDGEKPETVAEAQLCCAEMIKWAADHNRPPLGVGTAVLAGVLELIRTANYAVKQNAANVPTDLEFMRMLLCNTPFQKVAA